MAKYKFSDIAINSTVKKKPTEEDKLTYLGLEHLDSGCLQVTRFGSEVAPIGEKLIMKKGDVLFGKRRAYQKKVAIAPFDGIFSAHGMVLRPNENIINKEFFPFFISSDYFLDAAIKISVGSLSPTINWSTLKELEFELPRLEKQNKLAKILWAVEDTKKNCQESLDALIVLKKSYLNEIFSNTSEDINWTNSTFGEVFDFISTNNFSRANMNVESGSIHNIHYGDIHVKYSEILDVCDTPVPFLNDDVNLSKFKANDYCENGDIVIADTSEDYDGVCKAVEVINIGEEKILAGLHTFHCRPKKNLFVPGFLGYIMNSPYIHNQAVTLAAGIKVYGVSKKNLLTIRIPIPERMEQEKVVGLLVAIDKQINSLKIYLNNTNALQKKILRDEVSEDVQ